MRADEAEIGQQVIVRGLGGIGILLPWTVARCAQCGESIEIGDLYADIHGRPHCLDCVEPEWPEAASDASR